MTDKKKIKITYVIGSLERGGCELHLLKILPRLDVDQFDISLITLFRKGELEPEFKAHGVAVYTPTISSSRPSWWPGFLSIFWKIFYLLYASLRFVKHLVLAKPQIAHFFLPTAYMVGLPLSVLTGVKIRVMSRRSLNHYQTQYFLFDKIERLFHKKLHLVLGNSQAVVNQLIAEEEVPEGKVKLLYNGIMPHQPTYSKKEMRQKWQIPENCLVMTIIANLIPYKGHMDLLRALSLLSSEVDWHCLIVGDDRGILKQLKQEAQRLGIFDRITFTGQQSQTADFYEAADIGLLCSHQEGFSNAILEGMAAGLPMIVTDVGGNAEAVQHEKNGFVVPAQNPTALSQAMTKLLASQTLRQQYGAVSEKLIIQHFTIDNCVADYQDMYKTLSDNI